MVSTKSFVASRPWNRLYRTDGKHQQKSTARKVSSITASTRSHGTSSSGCCRHKQQQQQQQQQDVDHHIDKVYRVSRELFTMSRPQDVVPSLLLSLAGSWMTANLSFDVLLLPSVLTTAACSALIAAGSMLVNDCYDHRSGTDSANQRKSALQSGEIDMDDVVLVAGCIYGVVMLLSCCLEQPELRLLITLSGYITFVYTPLLKRVMLVKNIVVAGVIASSITAGGLAVAQSMTSIPPRTLASSVYLFLSILSREIVMDVRDMKGDATARVRTIPVCFGQEAGVFAAAVCAMAANLFLVDMVWSGNNSWYESLLLTTSSLGMLGYVILRLPMFSPDDQNFIGRDLVLIMAFGIWTMAISL